MTFGRPTSIANDYIPTELPYDYDLDAFEHLDYQTPKESPPQDPSTVIVYIHSMSVEHQRTHTASTNY